MTGRASPISHRRNATAIIFVNGRRAKSIDGLADLAGNVLSAYDKSVQRAISGLKRRASPAASRAVRANYNVKAGKLTGTFRAQIGTKGTKYDRDEYLAIWASKRQISLIDFGGRWSGHKSQGATAEIVRGNRKTYKGSFIATIQGLTAIRVRQLNDAGKRYGRGPVKILRGPSPFEMLSAADGSAAALNSKKKVIAELVDFYKSELKRQFHVNRERAIP